MSLIIPPAKNYQSPLVSIPNNLMKTPPEGAQMIVCEIDWGAMGGPSNCVYLNLQNNAAMNFSQITALSVDNSQCGADIQFLFPDTAETLSIPAYSPKVICPVFTNQTQFYILAPMAQTTDKTFFSILNTLPPPIAVPTTQEQNVAANNSISIISSGSPGTTQIVPAGVNGTLEGLFVGWTMGGSTATYMQWQLVDGASNVVAGNQATLGAGQGSGTGFDLTDLRVRFVNGLKINWTSQNVGYTSFLAVNAYYRTP